MEKKLLNILSGNDPFLRKEMALVVAEELKNTRLQELIENMFFTMEKNKGVGLAASQVGVDAALFIVEVDMQRYIFINPQIKHYSKDKVEMEEGCLSFPGIFKPVTRSKKITIAYLDEKGQKQRLKAKGLLARVIQHEFDHLRGVLFIDKESV